MTTSRRRGSFLPTALLSALPLLAAGFLAASPAAADTARGSAATASRGIVAQAGDVTAAQRARTLGYWTPARRAAAVPLDGLRRVVGPGKRGVRGPLGLPSLRPEQRRPARADRTAVRRLADTTGSTWTRGGRVARTVGKVYLTMGGRDYLCSATVVHSRNHDTVLTAGHCAKDGAGPWAGNWTFIPGYADGDKPYGVYTARRLFVSSQWADNADDNYDVAAVALNTDEGRHVADVTGSHPITFRASREVVSHAFGYPADAPFDGSRLTYCSGRTETDSTEGSRDHSLRCRMTAGSSGGPWFAGFDAGTGEGTIMSVISYKYADDPVTQYGPYLGNVAKSIYESASRA
ncbi:MAG: trypsin-like serine protease [Streptosporangiales bacterium]|nr:trypsin-like serine protease [Streptosporangiales bacterium]